METLYNLFKVVENNEIKIIDYDNINWKELFMELFWDILNLDKSKIDDYVFNRLDKNNPIYDFYNSQRDCHIVLKKFGLMLFFVKNKTPELCEIAVKNNHEAINYVDKQTPELCEIICRSSEFRLIENKTYDLCKKAVSITPYNLYSVDPNNITYEEYNELCKIAINKNPITIKFVKKQTLELCKLTIKDYSTTLRYIELDDPNEYLEICKIAIKSNPNELRNVKNINYNIFKELYLVNNKILDCFRTINKNKLIEYMNENNIIEIEKMITSYPY